MIRAVVDTNVLVSGLLSPAGNESLILLAIHQGLVRPCFSEEILEEYAAVLARPKFAFPPEEIATALTMFRSQGELFVPEGFSDRLFRSGRHQISAMCRGGAGRLHRDRQQAGFPGCPPWRDARRERRRTARPDYLRNLTATHSRSSICRQPPGGFGRLQARNRCHQRPYAIIAALRLNK